MYHSREVRIHDPEHLVNEVAVPVTHSLIQEIEDAFCCSPVLVAFDAFRLESVPDDLQELKDYKKVYIVLDRNAVSLWCLYLNFQVIYQIKNQCCIFNQIHNSCLTDKVNIQLKSVAYLCALLMHAWHKALIFM